MSARVCDDDDDDDDVRRTAGRPESPAMPAAKGKDLRWLVVFKRLVEEAPTNAIARDCRVSESFVKDTVSLFRRTGGVESCQGVRDTPPANQVMTKDAAQILWRRILDSPQTTREEHRLQLLVDGVVDTVHISTVCRACVAMNTSGKALTHYQAKHDTLLARAFVASIVNDYAAQMHLHVDETAKDGREFRRRGIAPIGSPAICSVGYFGGRRGLHGRKRLSYLVSFDINGFLAWNATDGTYDKVGFLAAAEEVIFPYITQFPGPRSLVFIDNATIHHSHAFVRRVNMCGGIVIFLPPYCFETSVLDNGAFGLVRRWLEANYAYLYAHGLKAAMDKALRSLTPEHARYCFRNCGYVVADA